MAVRHGYGKIAGTDALVFAYDTGDTRNSYRGEPTVNMVTNPTFIGTSGTQTHGVSTNWYFSGETGATGFKYYNSSTSPVPLKFPGEGAVITTGAGASNRRIYYNGTVEPNTTYTLSYWFYSSSFGSIANYFFTYKADGTGTTSPAYSQGFTTGQWVFIQQSFTTPADTSNTRQVNWGPVISGSTNSLFAMQRFQIEAKSHVTPFVNGTRSSTQGLVDLTGNSTIDLSNVSFDSNAQLFFDGTDDLAPITGLTISATQNKSYEAVIKLAAGYNLPGTIIGGARSTTNAFQIVGDRRVRGLEDDEFLTGVTILDTEKWYHVVYTFEFDGTSAYQKVYVNGILDNQRTIGTYIDGYVASAQYLGYDSRFSERFNGNIDICKVYNRALTAAEVRNNYNQYKTRFDI